MNQRQAARLARLSDYLRRVERKFMFELLVPAEQVELDELKGDKGARRDGRDRVGCIVLGRGAGAKQVERWLATAGSVPGFVGFAVGRTTFWDALLDWRANRITREGAVTEIARRYRHWVDIFEQAACATTTYEI